MPESSYPAIIDERSIVDDSAISARVEPAVPAQARNARAGLVGWLRHHAGLDRAIAFTVLARGWSSLAGLVTLVLIARFLTPVQQGYYYTFSSLVALQIVFELGFSFVVLQLAAHERAHLTISGDGRVQGDPVAHARLASVLQKSVRWYGVAACLMMATVIPAGFYFFNTHQRAGAAIAWQAPWFVMVLAAACTFQMDPVFSFLEGCGQVSQVARMRFGQAVVGTSMGWIALLSGHGLFAPAMLIAGQAFVGAVWLLRRRRLLLGLARYESGCHRVGWRTEIWPFQWKIAVSWLCGYFIFQLFNPVLFAYQGPAAAGQMGMSLSIASSLSAIAISWMSTKSAPFGNLVARGDFASLDRLFFRTLKQSTVLLAIGAAAFMSCLLYIAGHFPKLAGRVLAPWAFAFLLITVISNHVVFSESVYLRSHKREPFLIVSIINAVAVGAGTYFFGRFSGANAVALWYFFGSGVLGLLLGTYVFVTRRKGWHA